jgi:hypothetical protein
MKLLEEYDADLREWRSQLGRGKNNPQILREVREAIVALRKELRTRGYDLRLGSKDITLEGWRHDDAMGEGFQRLVIGIAEDDIYSLAGSANHIELADSLEQQWRRRKNAKPYRLHCLWYRWRNNVLVLSGWNLQRPELEEILKVWISNGCSFLGSLAILKKPMRPEKSFVVWMRSMPQPSRDWTSSASLWVLPERE